LTPAFVHDEIENYEDLIVEKSGMKPARVAQFIDLLFQYIDGVPSSEFYPAIEKADEAIVDILSGLKGEDSHGTAPLGWDGYGLQPPHWTATGCANQPLPMT